MTLRFRAPRRPGPVAGHAPASPAGRIAGLLVAVLVPFVAFGVVIPVLPVLVTERLGGNAFAVGLAFAASGVATLIARPYAGQLAQRFGSRTIMIGGCLIAMVTGGLYALPVGIPGLVATRLLAGVAEAMVFTAGSVWVVTLAPEARRGEIVGYYGLSMWTGWTVGPILGLLLGMPSVWWLAGLAPLVAVGVLLLLGPQPATGGAVSRRLIPKAVLLPGVALAMAAFGYAALTGFVALHLGARGIHDGAAMVSLFGGAYVVVRILFGRLPDRVGPGRVVIFCGAVEALGLLLLTTAPTWWQAAIGALAMGGGLTLLYPALALVVIGRADEAERGAALGAYTSFWDLGLGAAGLLAGMIALAGYPWVFAAATALAIGSAVIGHMVSSGSRR
ncbi:MFS transporter [Micromonospora sp. MS34]|uniref:MFS transporter n=1 Tax=Micromonospora sp. MS34 TaxID=3385971 RepID=UPI0039A27609